MEDESITVRIPPTSFTKSFKGAELKICIRMVAEETASSILDTEEREDPRGQHQ